MEAEETWSCPKGGSALPLLTEAFLLEAFPVQSGSVYLLMLLEHPGASNEYLCGFSPSPRW